MGNRIKVGDIISTFKSIQSPFHSMWRQRQGCFMQGRVATFQFFFHCILSYQVMNFFS